MSLRKRVEDLETVCNGLYREVHVERETRRSGERTLIRKIACGAVSHKFSLRWVVFTGLPEERIPCGKFECTECYLKVEHPLTVGELKAAEGLGMVNYEQDKVVVAKSEYIS